jgi:hypothetical protein
MHVTVTYCAERYSMKLRAVGTRNTLIPDMVTGYGKHYY